ncbi:zinc ribbon domain-containing protein [Variovorax sp.]|uniref:FmdB family zinc ribbon protein n=1 Tax=Variovorax sp. TaxID=1871043 RepID=UPI002D71AB33|nr:zinc ribbon domain-containing protein [Variovorax sp.]HYP82687.1 zinc ribbon domain-containing protein [Variovorax sp.]
MPLYDYACQACGRFSAMRPLREFDRPVPCPACGAPSERALSVPAVLGRASRQDDAPSGGAYPRLRHPARCACCPP